MKIAFFEIEDWERDYIKKNLRGRNLKFYFSDKELSVKTAMKVRNFDVVSVFIYSDINPEVLGVFKNLKAIATRSTGFDHIHLKECRARNVKVFNIPHYGENTVAEHAFGLILGLSKKIVEGYERVKSGNFSFEGLTGFDLNGKTIGIIGMGRIGSYVAHIARGFNMRVLAYNPSRNPYLEKKLGFRYVGFNELLGDSDIITLHAPLNEKTRHMINMKNINRIKKGAYLINTARGGLVETEALVKALKKSRIAGAGLDVLEEEDLMGEGDGRKYLTKNEKEHLLENHKLLKCKNVIITPHNAFNTTEALKRILDTTIKNIKSFSEGRIIKEDLVE